MIRKIKRFWNKVFDIRNSYENQGMLYLNNSNQPVAGQITSKVKWLDNLTIYHWSEEDAEKEAFKQLNEKYPQYKGMIWLS